MCGFDYSSALSTKSMNLFSLIFLARPSFRNAHITDFPHPEFRESSRWMHAGFSALVTIAQKCWKLRDVAAME